MSEPDQTGGSPQDEARSRYRGRPRNYAKAVCNSGRVADPAGSLPAPLRRWTTPLPSSNIAARLRSQPVRRSGLAGVPAHPRRPTWFSRQRCVLRGRWAQTPDINYPVEVISGVPVVTAPAEIDVATAEQLRVVLVESAADGQTTVVDMTRTQFCDSSGLSVLVRAHKRALEEGSELRLVIPADSAVFRIFTLTSLYRFIPRFDSLEEALLPRPAATSPLRSRPSSGLRGPVHQPGPPDSGV
jgi:anti-sigma B factor antagonist